MIIFIYTFVVIFIALLLILGVGSILVGEGEAPAEITELPEFTERERQLTVPIWGHAVLLRPNNTGILGKQIQRQIYTALG